MMIGRKFLSQNKKSKRETGITKKEIVDKVYNVKFNLISNKNNKIL
jgi:hypothetical protein